jgi:hypothetical protein
MNPSKTERQLDDSRVDYIGLKVTEGSATPFLWAFTKLDGQEYRVNGQHSSAALAKMNGNLPDNLIAHIDEYEVNDEHDLVHLFRQFDPRKSSRTPMDVANAYASIVPELAGIDTRILKVGAEGINWGRGTIDRLPPKKADDRYEELTHPQNLEFLQMMGRIYNSKTDEMRPLPVIAAMYKTFFVDLERAEKFWSSVARQGDEYNEQDPARVLDTFLRQIRDKKGRQEVSALQLYQACIFAWNAEMDGKQVPRIIYDIKKGVHDPKYPS